MVRLEKMFELMPRLVNETLYFWIIRSGLMMIKVQTDRDDQILLEEHCDFIVRILRFGLSASIWKLFWKLKFYILTNNQKVALTRTF